MSVSPESAHLDTNPRWAYFACFTLIAISYFSFGLSLDRYPPFWFDEAQFNMPAARFIEGHGFNWRMTPDMPHGDTIWAVHGPFYPRLQVITFKLLGVTQFACRILPYLAGHLALAVLCLYFLRCGYWKIAIVLPVIWMGDRSFMELQAGRPDGLALLCLVIGFICLSHVILTGTIGWSAGFAACLGLVAGFHPVAFYFGCSSVVLLAFTMPPRAWPRLMLGFCLGGILPVVLWLVCWVPQFTESFQQFRWFIQLGHLAWAHRSRFDIIGLIRWSKWWLLGLSMVVLFWLIPYAISLLRQRKSGQRLVLTDIWILCSTAFACAFFLVFAHAKWMLPPYLIYFTIWPVLALLILWDTGVRKGLWANSYKIVIGIAVACWLPSAAWNTMRLREVILHYRSLDSAPFAAKLHNTIPEGATVTGTILSDQLIVTHKAGLKYQALSDYIGTNVTAIATSWLLVAEEDLRRKFFSEATFVNREVFLDESEFPDVKYHPMRHHYLLYGPVGMVRTPKVR